MNSGHVFILVVFSLLMGAVAFLAFAGSARDGTETGARNDGDSLTIEPRPTGARVVLVMLGRALLSASLLVFALALALLYRLGYIFGVHPVAVVLLLVLFLVLFAWTFAPAVRWSQRSE